MLSCVRCGQCLTSCPTYILSGHESEGPRGRIAMMRGLLEGRLEVTPELLQHEQNCLVCDACTAVCPAGVHMDPLQVALRSAIEPAVRRTPWQRAIRHVVFRRVFSDMGSFRRLIWLIWLYQRSGLQLLARTLGVLHVLGLAKPESLLPPVSHDFLVPQGELLEADPPQPDAPTVSFFAGCVMSTALADIDRATIRVLRRAGYRVELTAGQGCCGALNAHGGDVSGALPLAQRNIQAFEAGGDQPIVNNAAGCGAMLKDYGHHFRGDAGWAERASAFSRRVKDLTELLAERPIPFRRGLAIAATYQEPCHLAHAQRITRQPRAILKTVPELELREMTESTLCCGSAGIYNVTNPTESEALCDRKLANAASTGADVIVTANPGCLMQLQAGLKARGQNTRVAHIAELLDEASAP